MTVSADNMRLEVLWAVSDMLFGQCREEGMCVCGEPWGGHNYNGCIQFIRTVKAAFLRRCDELGVEVP